MKYLSSLLLGLALFPLSLSAQLVAVELESARFFYRGVDNPITIAVEKDDCEEITVMVDHGKVIDDGDGQYTVKINRSGTETMLRVFKGKCEIHHASYTLKNVPDPVPVLGDLPPCDYTIGYDELMGVDAMRVHMPDFAYDLKFRVTSFKMTVIRDETVISVESDGEEITDRMKEVMSHLEPGKKVYFENIVARGPEGTSRKLGSMVFILEG